MAAQGLQLCCTGPAIILHRGCNYATQGLQLYCTGAAIIPHMAHIINIWWPQVSKTPLYAWFSAPYFDMSFFPASPLFKHLVNATKHRYTRGFGHVQKRAHRARETMIFVGFAHRARDLLVFNIKVCFSVRASFRGGTYIRYIYVYIYMRKYVDY